MKAPPGNIPGSRPLRISRRSALQKALAAGGLSLAISRLQSAAAQASPAASRPPDFGLEPIGQLQSRLSLSIAESPLSVGFETLDRRMFEPQKTYAHLAALGVKWARCQTGWARTETVQGKFDFDWLDSVVDSLRRIGIQPWFNLGYGNRLYTPDAPDDSAIGWVPLNSPEATEAWLRYVERISSHFAGRVRHWEIWNEPNISNFWHPNKPDAAKYVDLIRMTAPIIRRHVSGAQIIGGALAGMPASFLEEGLKQGLGELVDKISYHPYRPLPESKYDEEMQQFRELIARHKPSLKFWQGENGCPSLPGSSGALGKFDWDESKQAKWLLRRILSDLRLGVELTSYFHTVDLLNYNWGNGSTGKANTKGLLRGNDYTPKPAYFAYQSLCAIFDSQTVKAEPSIEVAADQEVVSASFTRNSQPLHAFWRPVDLHRPFLPERARLAIRIPESDPTAKPVLVDPLTARIYNLQSTMKGTGLVISSPLPLMDYPLIATTQAAITF